MAGKYEIILADPPWKYNNEWAKNPGNGAAEAHYHTLTTPELCALSVGDLAADNAVLFLWATWPKIPDALQVISAWGFEYKTTGFVWIKQNPAGFGLHMGLGRWSRANTEPCLLATRGKPHRRSAFVRQTVLSPVRQHSRKPEEVHEKIVDLMGDLPRIELFARRPYQGWDVWGNEVESDIEMEMAV